MVLVETILQEELEVVLHCLELLLADQCQGQARMEVADQLTKFHA